MTDEEHEHPTDHPDFQITAYPGGVVDIAVCWDRMDVPAVAEALHQIADGLQNVPPGVTGEGVVPL